MAESEEKPPAVLYQYWPFETALKVLTTRTLAFTPPVRFDDPFDSNPAINLDLTREDLERYFDDDKFGRLSGTKEDFVRTNLSYPALAIDALIQTRDEFLNDIGVACFTGLKNDPGMWALYGERHRGVMIGFHSSHSFFLNQFKKVEYHGERPAVRKMDQNPMPLLRVKGKHWEWQQEWRIGQRLNECQVIKVDPPIYVIAFPYACIKSITFGSRASEKTIDEVSAAVRWWRHLHDFELHRNRICEYTYNLIGDPVA